jgi:hypothetical protein
VVRLEAGCGDGRVSTWGPAFVNITKLRVGPYIVLI